MILARFTFPWAAFRDPIIWRSSVICLSRSWIGYLGLGPCIFILLPQVYPVYRFSERFYAFPYLAYLIRPIQMLNSYILF